MNAVQTDARQVLTEMINKGQVAAKDLDFAKSITRSPFPSEKQLFWINKLIERYTAPAVVAPQAQVETGGMVALFAKAGTTLKRPKINVQMPGTTTTIRFSLAPASSKNAGAIYIKRVDTEEPVYLGKIMPNGAVMLVGAGREIAGLVEFIEWFAANPAEAAKGHGKLTGNCCFCSLTLTDSRSVDAGYGPICADNWGLPWGS